MQQNDHHIHRHSSLNFPSLEVQDGSEVPPLAGILSVPSSHLPMISSLLSYSPTTSYVLSHKPRRLPKCGRFPSTCHCDQKVRLSPHPTLPGPPILPSTSPFASTNPIHRPMMPHNLPESVSFALYRKGIVEKEKRESGLSHRKSIGRKQENNLCNHIQTTNPMWL